ncbi:MAG: imidazole glycerol phosphate synthase subunit HisH [Candidatus Omnitrophica bacterium]|nr:imidazole glycerol phosphate synthase subunit HisH [Candidatus Omnitrophota bacterium]
MIAIIDYGMGNLRSVQKAMEKVGGQAIVTHKPEDILNAAKVVLPGVGAMAPAMEQLQSLGLIDSINKSIAEKKPFLGICLGYQLLFESSNEGGNVKGLGLLKGTVERFSNDVKVPHMGWNQLQLTDRAGVLFNNIDPQACVYFCHSYFVRPKDGNVVATTTDYGVEFASAVCHNNIFGVQFHPEKSQTTGLTILKNFINL